MGYELSIQRRDDAKKITVKEWATYISSDPEFVSIEEFSAPLSDGTTLVAQIPNAQHALRCLLARRR